MDVREKLVELLKTNACPSPFMCDQACKYYGYGDCFPDRYADHLISNGVTVQEWISVKDRLPEEKVNCIVHYKHAYYDNDDYWAIGICFYDGDKFQLNSAYKVTHWMPLPEPPKGAISEKFIKERTSD